MHGIVKLACGRAVGDSVPASIGSDHPVRLFTRRRKTKSIMPIMSQILRRLGRWGVIPALWCSLANGASAAEKDWLDEMPSVPAVIQAVREQVELARQQNPALAKDEDFLAEDIVGTFVLLRWVMDMQSDKEWYTSEEWRKRMRGIEMGYMQVELAIGLGVGKRKGHIKDNCDHKDSYLNRLGQKMHATPVECYQHRFHVDLSNVYPSFNHRNAIFPLLFCDRARYYLDLVQEQVRKTPPPRRMPAQTLSLPDGMRPLGPAVCEHYRYDSDRNKNGLCDDWEKPLTKTSRVRTATADGCRSPEAAPSKSACLSPIKPDELEAFVNNKNNEEDKGFTKLRLVGPYPCIDAAAANAVRMIHVSADSGGQLTEFGLLIMKPRQIADRYYFTVPVPGPVGKCPDGAVVGIQDYEESKKRAFLNLCDSSTNYRIVGNVHSHPTLWCFGYQNRFSPKDIDGAITGMVGDNIPLEKIFLVAPNNSYYQFAPKQGDQIIGPVPSWTPDELTILKPAFYGYTNRTQLFSDNNVVCGKSK